MEERVKALVLALLPLEDAKFDALYQMEEASLLEYCRLKSLDDSHTSLLSDLIIWRAQRAGSEAAISESYSGVSYQYTEDLPTVLRKRLNKARRLRW